MFNDFRMEFCVLNLELQLLGSAPYETNKELLVWKQIFGFV